MEHLYFYVERLINWKWTEVQPADITSGDVFRMFFSRGGSTVHGVAGEHVWLATSNSFRRLETKMWAAETMRVNPIRELSWRFRVLSGQYDSEIPPQ